MTTSKTSLWLKRICLGIGVIFIIAQFFQPDRTPPVNDPSDHFYQIENPPADLKAKLDVSCMDCHSNKTRYPWYSYITPLSFWIYEHVEHGQEEMNLSAWGQYPLKKKIYKLKEWVEEVEEAHMPLDSYLILHQDAKLSAPEKKAMLDWVKSRKAELEAQLQETPASP